MSRRKCYPRKKNKIWKARSMPPHTITEKNEDDVLKAEEQPMVLENGQKFIYDVMVNSVDAENNNQDERNTGDKEPNVNVLAILMVCIFCYIMMNVLPNSRIMDIYFLGTISFVSICNANIIYKIFVRW